MSLLRNREDLLELKEYLVEPFPRTAQLSDMLQSALVYLLVYGTLVYMPSLCGLLLKLL